MDCGTCWEMSGNGFRTSVEGTASTSSRAVRSITLREMCESPVGSARHPIFATVTSASLAPHPCGRRRNLQRAVLLVAIEGRFLALCKPSAYMFISHRGGGRCGRKLLNRGRLREGVWAKL